MSILDRDLGNKTKHTLLFSVEFIIHFLYAIFFLVIGAYIPCVLEFAAAFLFAGVQFAEFIEKRVKHILTMVMVLYTVVNVLSILDTLAFGEKAYFLIYPISALVIVIYNMYLMCSPKLFLGGVIASIVIALSAQILSLRLVHKYGALYSFFGTEPLTDLQTTILRDASVVFNTGLVFIFSFMFVLEINSALNKLRKSNERLDFLASHDPLTELYNRRYLGMHFSEGAENGYCVALGDIDNFKKFNDTYGHDCGDDVLQAVAGILREEADGCGDACRWGGEELLVLFRTDSGEAMRRVERIMDKIRAYTLDYKGEKLHITMTFGFADSRCEDIGDITKLGSFENLVEIADKRLYIGKADGKNKIVAADYMKEEEK